MSDALETKMALAVSDAVEDGTISGGDTGPDVAVDSITTPTEATPTSTATDATTTPEAAVATKAEEDELFKELGLKPRPDGKENRIPYGRVKAIAENQRKKAAAEFDAKMKEHTDKVTAYEQRLEAIAQTEQIMRDDPRRFLAILPSLNPEYAKLVNSLAAAERDVVVDERPKPDLQLPDGTLVYSAAAQEKLDAWREHQTEKRFTERIGPIEKKFQVERLIEEARPGVEAQLAAAEKWPLWNEVSAEVLAALQDPKNPAATLEAAYQRVAVPKLQANRDAMRADILREMQQTPKTLLAPTSGARLEVQSTIEERMLEELKTAGLVK